MPVTFEPVPEWLLDGLEDQIQTALLRLEIPRRLDGFDYLTCAVILAIQDPQCLKRITKGIYPVIAKRFRTDISCVERSIRTAINRCWCCGGREALGQMAGYHLAGRPTNSELIELLAAYIRKS